MIPVFDLKKIRAAIDSQSPEVRRRNQQQASELLKAAIRSTEEYKRICEEKGIPYVPCVAADPYGSNYYTGATKRTSQVKLGDLWDK
jgi:hypothetical protein